MNIWNNTRRVICSWRSHSSLTVEQQTATGPLQAKSLHYLFCLPCFGSHLHKAERTNTQVSLMVGSQDMRHRQEQWKEQVFVHGFSLDSNPVSFVTYKISKMFVYCHTGSQEKNKSRQTNWRRHFSLCFAPFWSPLWSPRPGLPQRCNCGVSQHSALPVSLLCLALNHREKWTHSGMFGPNRETNKNSIPQRKINKSLLTKPCPLLLFCSKKLKVNSFYIICLYYLFIYLLVYFKIS